MSERTAIKTIKTDKTKTGAVRGKFLYLRKAGTKTKGGEYFKVLDTVGEGGSCVCYNATLLSEKKTGRLKEFYPLVRRHDQLPFDIERTAQNYVAASAETQAVFSAAREEFVQSYQLLRQVMEENKNNADFTSFIPDFSIYYACDEDGDFVEGSTAYIWTAPEKLIVFEDYIESVHKHPNAHPEHKLFNILKTTLALTECIKVLHTKGLLHLDIKPGNFGVPKREGKLLTDSITLFDVNTIFSLKSAFTTDSGTEGFRAPEVSAVSAGNGTAAKCRPDNTSDIYSIGCTLFSALVVNDQIQTPGYSKEYYTKLQQLIDTSRLITATETNSNIYLKLELCNILKKCLAQSQSKRYQSCVELARDLEKALVYLYPSQYNPKLPLNKQMVIMDKELDKKSGASSFRSFLYHLYKKPLFEFIPTDSETIDVLILGFGNYGQRFMDACLQAGQMLGKRLNVTIASNKPQLDKSVYIEKRPELMSFFSVDGSVCNEPYGYISFKECEFIKGSANANRDTAKAVAGETSQVKYVFVALGDDALNKSVAQAVHTVVNSKTSCSVNFVWNGEHINGRFYGNPVYICDSIEKEPLYQELERMAFNSHIVWENGLNIDMARSFAKFKEPYCYNSSFSNVISIKYKLHSIGIKTDDLTAAAAEYYEKVINAKDEKLQKELTALEHKRWNCEKICDGWTLNADLSTCLTGVPNDKVAKKHITMVRSTSKTPLQDGAWDRNTWDTASEGMLGTLDELDRVSVRLHQTYKKRADELKRESSLQDSYTQSLKSIMKKKTATSIAFSEWFSCLTLIWNGNITSVREYGRLKDVLIASLSELGEDKISITTAKTLIGLIDQRFSAIMKSMEYTDYKKKDIDLVIYIPFILTYRKDINIAIPMSCGTNTKMFSNVAVATIANPANITYLCHFNRKEDISEFNKTLSYITNYMVAKNVSSKLNFVITHPKDKALSDEVAALKERLTENSGAVRVQRVILRQAEDDTCIAQRYGEVFDSVLRADAVEQNETPLSYLLIGAGFYTSHPGYSFDINTKTFSKVRGCNFLQYIKSQQYLKVSDMFASKNSKGYLDSPTAFYNDYQALWDKAYRRNEFVWKKSCKLIKDHCEEADKVATFAFETGSTPAPLKKYRFIIAASAYEGARKLIEFMVAAKVFERDSEVYYYTTDSCEVNITAAEKFESKLRGIFADLYMLSTPDRMVLSKTPHSASLAFDNLTVKDLDMSKGGKHTADIKALLKKLETDFAFITGYTESAENNNLISFTFATPRIKKLLTAEGNILEIYTYYRCLNSGLFDDVATGYEIEWEGTPITSEFDIIVTKGFSGLLIETKAQTELSQDYYFKLSCLANQFGTNCKAVLVADTIENYLTSGKENNDMQRQRGDILDVVTISDSRDISSVEKPLARLLGVKLPALSVKNTTAAPIKPANQAAAPVKQASPELRLGDTDKEQFLAKKITRLGLETVLSNAFLACNIKTVGDLLAQSEESLAKVEGKKGVSLQARSLEVQAKLKKQLNSL